MAYCIEIGSLPRKITDIILKMKGKRYLISVLDAKYEPIAEIFPHYLTLFFAWLHILCADGISEAGIERMLKQASAFIRQDAMMSPQAAIKNLRALADRLEMLEAQETKNPSPV